MGRIRFDIEVNSIDLSILCYEDYSIDSIQVFKGRKWINGHPHDTFGDVGWMFNTDGLAAIEAKLDEAIRDHLDTAWEHAA
jgi:hypothetical protein